MKTLRKNDDFKKMPDKNWLDHKNIEKMIGSGWKYVSRKEWKEFRGDVLVKEIEKDDKEKNNKNKKMKKEK